MRRILVSVFCLVMLAGFAAVSVAASPMISYQGRLMQPSGAPVADGTYSMTFAIYDVPTGGTPLWSELVSVQVAGGLYNVFLTNLSSDIFNNSSRFFGITVGNDAEMTPRQQIAQVPFAVKADQAAAVDDNAVASSTIQDGAVVAAKIASGAVSADKIASGALTGDKIADGAITTTKIADNTISSGKIQDASVTSEKLATGVVKNQNVAVDAAIQSSKVDFTSMVLINGTRAPQPKIVCGSFSAATTAGQIVEKIVDYGTTFASAPIVVVTPGAGYNSTSMCTASVQETRNGSAKICITDSVSNPLRYFTWMAIGY